MYLEKSGFIHLEIKDFDENGFIKNIDKEIPVLILYKISNCKPCDDLLIHLNFLNKEHKDILVVVIDINKDWKDLTLKIDPKFYGGFPHLVLHYKKNKYSYFNQRTYRFILSFINKIKD